MGHKQLCIFTFNNDVPVILSSLHRNDNKVSTLTNAGKYLGFCNFMDFEEMTKKLVKE